MRQLYGIYIGLSTKHNYACQTNTPVFCAKKHTVCTCVALKKLRSAIYKKIIRKSTPTVWCSERA